MVKTLERGDTFIVVRKGNDATRNTASPSATTRLPSGTRVHTLDSAVYERAVKAAMGAVSKKK